MRRCHRRHAEPGSEIGRPRDTGKLAENRIGSRQVVHQHHGARTISTGIDANRWPLPEHVQFASIFRVQGTIAVPYSTNEGTSRFLSENVTIRFAPSVNRFFDDQSKSL